MARKNQPERSPYTLLVVDDDPDYLAAVQPLLAGEGHTVLVAKSGREAIGTLRDKPVDVVFLDYFMPEMTGEQVVQELRTFNPEVQVILQTGYSGEQPPRDMLKRLNIQGYHDKADGPEKLLLWADVGLKAADRERELSRRVKEAVARIKVLNGLLPMCAWCKKIRDDDGYWAQIESYIAAHSEADFSHGICPECYQRMLTQEEDEDLGEADEDV